MKILSQIGQYLWTRKFPLNFRSFPDTLTKVCTPSASVAVVTSVGVHMHIHSNVRCVCLDKNKDVIFNDFDKWYLLTSDMSKTGL